MASNIAQARRPMNQRREMQSKHLDDGVADLQLVLCQLNFSKHAQSWGMCNLDLEARILISPIPQEDPLEALGVYHCDAVHSGPVDLHAPETAADDAETQRWQQVALNVEDLQHGAPGEDEVHVVAVHDGAAEAELAEAGEGGAPWQGGRVREPPEAEVEAGERGHAEEGGGEMLVDGERKRAVDEEELLDALGSEELEPAFDPGAVLLHVAAGDADAAERARVRDQDAGDRGGHGVRVGVVEVDGDLVVAGREEVSVDEDERGGAPDGAPTAGEHRRARGFLDGEARDDVA